LTARLQRLRQQAQRRTPATAWAGGCSGCWLGYTVTSMLGAVGMMLLLPFVDYLNTTAGMYSFPLFTTGMQLLELLGAVGGAIAGWMLAGIFGRKVIEKSYRLVWQELWSTNIMTLVVHEEYAEPMLAQAEQTFLLRWISPPRPRTLEHQLEFAACYLPALRKLQWGMGRLDSGLSGKAGSPGL